MKRIDTDSAINASTVTIVQKILDALADASGSPEAQIILAFKEIDKCKWDINTGTSRSLGTGVRIEYGSCHTFIETSESGRSYAPDLFNLTGVFRFLSKALAQRNEDEESEIVDRNREAAFGILDKYSGVLNGESDAKDPADAE